MNATTVNIKRLIVAVNGENNKVAIGIHGGRLLWL